MARGWESKSIEAQRAEATIAKSAQKPRLTREEAAQLRETETLKLARQRVLEQLKSNPNPRHTEMLGTALREIEFRLAALDAPSSAKATPKD